VLLEIKNLLICLSSCFLSNTILPPASFYLDLAYGGLYNSNATNTIFNSLVPNQDDRDRIKARISAEADNTTNNGVSPAGKKAC
jgi:hypothetical protein